MLTIATASGTVQYHRYEYVRLRIDGTVEEQQVKDWICEGKDGVGININPGDEIRVNGQWRTEEAVSWNAAFDRENEAERASRKAERDAEKARQSAREAEEKRQIAAGMSADDENDDENDEEEEKD